MAEIRRADPTARRQAVILVAAAAVAGTLLLYTFELYREPLLDWLRSKPRETATTLLLVTSALLFPLPLLVFAAYLWSLGARTVRAEMFPPPGLRVIHDTEVIAGKPAVLRGRRLETLAVCLAILAVLASLVIGWLATK